MEERMSGFCITRSGGNNNIRASNGGGGGGGGNNCGSTGTKCGRWNPTTEQVKVLTDLFRSGLRTPSTDQIQKISTQLSFYGKIESKNVFYWFQNHKARERQKRRRVSVNLDNINNNIDQKDHHHQVLRRDDNSISSATYFTEINQICEAGERVVETLQLFPLNSFEQEAAESPQKLRSQANEAVTFSCGFGAENIDHPPLDLRLSFL